MMACADRIEYWPKAEKVLDEANIGRRPDK